MKTKNKLIVFQGNNIRRIWHNEEWWFSVVDIIEILTESSIPKRYWSDLKIKLKEEGSEVYDKIVRLKLKAEDGKMRESDCANTEGAFRIIQSISSKKAEPMKLWLAKVGYERVEEIDNPELAQKRMKELYKQKGYSNEWIEKRVRGIAIREELTDEWKNREVETEKEFAILTNEISNASFGKTVGEYKEFKQLKNKNQNLRDHMTDWELILTMVGEKATTDITKERDSQEFVKLKKDAKEGGEIAGNTRKDIEKKLGKSVISKDNYLDKPEKEKRKLLKKK
ncbi:MAG: Bro-N domain-containing protein [Nanoarchaeota archaeon]|nr:Bro-N domain-containing protein [Nanoarchaeota archaeon]